MTKIEYTPEQEAEIESLANQIADSVLSRTRFIPHDIELAQDQEFVTNYRKRVTKSVITKLNDILVYL